MGRFILEGEWSGYSSSQRRIVHREVVTAKVAEKAREIGSIVYTDGTRLDLYTRAAKSRERVQEINGYGRLIREAIKHGKPFVNVRDLS